jgi:hypothetical protein
MSTTHCILIENGITYYPSGRLGNAFFRNIAVSRIAQKHDLFVEYAFHEQLAQLGIPLYVGKNRFTQTIRLNDRNYFGVLNGPQLNANLHSLGAFFQKKELTRLLYSELMSPAIKVSIMDNNPFNIRYDANNDIYMHIRLGDIAKENMNIGPEYYIKMISRIPSYDTLYISTDSKDHAIINQLVQKYPTLKIIEYDEIKTIQFASTCKHIVLSHGTFSAMIGYLGFYSDVYYPADELAGKSWSAATTDIFCIDGWTKINKS